MTIGGFTIGELAQILTMAGVIFMIARGIITKKECDKCKNETEDGFKDGRKEFKEMRRVQTDHGEQLAGISSTVNGMAGNVQTLVDHHIGGK
jgi:hypothetical protein